MTSTRITPAPGSGSDHDDLVTVEPDTQRGRIIVTADDRTQHTSAYVDAADVPTLALAALLASGVPAPTVEPFDDGFGILAPDGRRLLYLTWGSGRNEHLAATAAAYLLAAQALAAGPPAPEPDPEAEARAAVPDAAVDALILRLYPNRDTIHDVKVRDWAREVLVPVLAAALKATEPDPEPAWTPAVGEWVVVRGTEDTPRRVEEWDGSRARVRGLTFRQFLADLRPATPSDTGAEYLPGDPIPDLGLTVRKQEAPAR